MGQTLRQLLNGNSSAVQESRLKPRVLERGIIVLNTGYDYLTCLAGLRECIHRMIGQLSELSRCFDMECLCRCLEPAGALSASRFLQEPSKETMYFITTNPKLCPQRTCWVLPLEEDGMGKPHLTRAPRSQRVQKPI